MKDEITILIYFDFSHVSFVGTKIPIPTDSQGIPRSGIPANFLRSWVSKTLPCSSESASHPSGRALLD